MLVTIDRAGSLEHQASQMLQLLEHILEKQPVAIRIFDTSRKTEKYECSVVYGVQHAEEPQKVAWEEGKGSADVPTA